VEASNTLPIAPTREYSKSRPHQTKGGQRDEYQTEKLARADHAPAVFEDEPDAKTGERALEAFERGMDKLRDMLAARRR
jgi:hypothetical protein